jgi:phosphohistidine phosphatase
MRRLMLLRHAKTERAGPGERDRDRKLMKRGRSDAPVIGTYMAHHNLVPDLALVSPATRAQETWALVAPSFAKSPKMTVEDRIYNAGTGQLVDLIREPRTAKSLLLVGHNPGFHELAVQMVASGDVSLRGHLNEGLPTSGLVVNDLPND